MDLVDVLAARVDGDHAIVGLVDARQEVVDADLERGDFRPVLRDVCEIGLRARADLVDRVDFGFHRAHDLLAARHGLHVAIELVCNVLDLGEP